MLLSTVSRNIGEIEMLDGKDTGSSDNLPDITCLIRSVQRIEGNPDCFGKADGNCDRLDCAWREYCLKEAQK
ncbi:MAG: SAP domain-containing protein [Thermodesulfobacteriota bacterium]|nr:SAP domain-containing protein [Thermodesulfobacteriota bacterium]